MKNPYNCIAPGNLFVGRQQMRNKIINKLHNNKLYVIIGARHCGKTSFLKQIKNDLLENNSLSIRFIPCLFSTDEFNVLTTAKFYQKIYEVTTQNTDAPDWVAVENGYEYDGFLKQMRKARESIQKKIAKEFAIVLLIDEMDAAIDDLKKDRLFKNLRHFLTESDLCDDFRLVASGMQYMNTLINDDTSWFHIWDREYLHPLSFDSAKQLIRIGLKDKVNANVESMILELTGRHPFLMQGLCEKIYENSACRLDKERLTQISKEFLNRHGNNCFRNWVNNFSFNDHTVYQYIANSADGTLPSLTLNDMLPLTNKEIDDSLKTLGYHGVIDDTDINIKRIGATMFRDWYREWYKNNANTVVKKTPVVDFSSPSPHEAVSIKTFGKFTITVDGSVIDISVLKEKQSLTLLKLIISLGSINIQNSDIENVLWPNHYSSENNLNQGINRLKKFLNSNHPGNVVLRHAGITSLNKKICCIDSLIFAESISKSNICNDNITTLTEIIHDRFDFDSDTFKARISQGLQGMYIEPLEKAIKLYQGDFLPEDTAVYVQEYRNTLKKNYINSVIALSFFYIANSNYSKALHYIKLAQENNCGIELLYTLSQKIKQMISHVSEITVSDSAEAVKSNQF